MVMKLLAVSLVGSLAVSAVAAQYQPSNPTPGQFSRYRALPQGSNLAVVPVDGAEFVTGQHFDISIELHNDGNAASPSVDGIIAEINGVPMDQFFGTSWTTQTWNFTYSKDASEYFANPPKTTPVGVTRLALRDIALPTTGDFNVTIAVGKERVSASWSTRNYCKPLAKNTVMFIGDGMAPAMISAARFISRPTKFGKFAKGAGFLNLENLGSVGKVSPNGIDSIITDSANSAAAYHTGQKGWVNALNVYADTSADTLDDPKVETLAEMLRRLRPNVCVGVVTTSALWDATPAAVFSHTRRRSDSLVIAGQALNGANSTKYPWSAPPVRPDVFLGGGGNAWCKGASPCNATTGYYADYTNAGYTFVSDKDQLSSYQGNGPLLGVFTNGHMETWIDRNLWTENLDTKKNSPFLTGSALKQPNFDDMVMKAINLMDARCSEGWFLMAEAASIDKMMHPMDYDRGLADLLELDRTVKKVVDHDAAHYPGQTAILLTADHAQGYDVWGTVDTKFFNNQPTSDSSILDGQTGVQSSDYSLQIQKRMAIGEYDFAGWMDIVIDANGNPTNWQGQYKLAGGKVDGPQSRDNFQIRKNNVKGNPLGRNPAVSNKALTGLFQKQYPNVAVNSVDPDEPEGLNFNGRNSGGEVTSVHTLQAVDLYCNAPIARLCRRAVDNTEVFQILAQSLGLGDPKQCY
ncbi:alkaline-phosphatase-like protein [Polychytrium aggregatum]|uniref:alkaline-phosphatase-like protein n=1 Tax=Polychytrium aggregatum TaxID=110093 RepID=UPI0022FEC6A8|nr:alkaline-phosphatase-like protein [Polychytrium aggregatum]KAI9203856.1 alkaline-phosphatase-like protein [Polychytrium aggregatum]